MFAISTLLPAPTLKNKIKVLELIYFKENQ
jgi:hypothetical protein